jgi:hypothetical protein
MCISARYLHLVRFDGKAGGAYWPRGAKDVRDISGGILRLGDVVHRRRSIWEQGEIVAPQGSQSIPMALSMRYCMYGRPSSQPVIAVTSRHRVNNTSPGDISIPVAL